MIIVSDTGPLRYLIEIDAIHLLPLMYLEVLTTPDVIDELKLPNFPPAVQSWALSAPRWLKIVEPEHMSFLDLLHRGEASALSLAIQCKADAVLIDERVGTQVARANGLRTVGTLAILQTAGLQRLIDYHATVRQLTTQTRFRHSPQLIAQLAHEFDALTKPDPGQS